MTPELRMQLQIARTGQFGDIMRTTLFAQLAIAAIIGFGGATGIGLAMIVVTIAVALFGAIGGGAALDDIASLRDDMDPGTQHSRYGQQARSRNLGLLKRLSIGLIALTALAEVLAILFG